MKKNLFLTVGTALLCLFMLGACKDKQDSKEKDADDEEILDEDDMDDADKDDIASFEEESLSTEKEDLYVPDDNEVWKALGGTYLFSDNAGTMVALNATPFDDEQQTLTIGDDCYNVTIDEDTGCITAVDDDDNVVFKGYVVDGGNTLKGTYRGKLVTYDGMGGL